MRNAVKYLGILTYFLLAAVISGVFFCNLVFSSDTGFLSRFESLCLFFLSHSGKFFYAFTFIAFGACLYRLRKLPARFVLKSSRISEEEIKKSKFNVCFKANNEIEFAADDLKRNMKSLGFSVLEEQSGKEIYFWAEKHRLERWGAYIAHLGIAVVMAGAVIAKMFGYEDAVTMVPEAAHRFDNANLELKLEKFDIGFYKDSNVPYYIASTAGLYENGKMLKSSAITYNNPLQYGDLRFFQSQYETVLGDIVVDVDLKEINRRRKSRLVTLEFGKDVRLEGTDLAVSIDSFVPDFGEDGQGVYSRSPQWNNPAVLLSMYRRGQLISRDWLFKLWPAKPKNVLKSRLNYSLRLVEMHDRYASTIFVSSDPGMKFVMVGFGLFMIGIILKCYLKDRAFKALLREENGKTAVFVSGHALRDEEMFSYYFGSVIKKLKG